MKKINLLHLKTSATTGGAEAMLTYWAKYLDREKFNQFTIFAERGSLVEVMDQLDVRVRCLPALRGVWGLAQIPILASLLREERIDLIHAHGARVNLWGSCAAVVTGIPIIATEHNIDLWREKNRLFTFLDRFPARINKFRVGVSEAVCDMLRGQGMHPDKVVCIDNGIEVERFDVSVNVPEIRGQLGIPSDAQVIGTVGRLVEQKGHVYLIEAFKRLEGRFPETRLLIVGDGPLRDILRQQVRIFGIEGKVVFAGQRTDIPELLAAMDIFALPSVTEGLPLALLEAMAAGKPIVASRVSGIPFVIEHEKTGLLVPPCNPEALAQEIGSLLDKREIAERLASGARKRVIEKYNVRAMIACYESLYERTLSTEKN